MYFNPFGSGSRMRAWLILGGVVLGLLLPEHRLLAEGKDKNGVAPNSISVPKGPGSIEGLGDSFQPSLNTGTTKYGLGIRVPPGTGGFQPTTLWKQDTQEARRLLAEAGYPSGKGLPKFDYLYNTSEGSQMVAQTYQEMWRRELGVEIELRNLEWKVYLSAMHKGEFHLARGAWVGDYNDPNTFLEMLITGNELNQSNWSDAEYDRLLGLAAQETDGAKRFDYFQKAEARLISQAPVLPVVFNKNKFLIRPEVQGWYPTLLDQHPFTAVRLVPAKGD